MNARRFRAQWPVLGTILRARFPQLERRDLEWRTLDQDPPLDRIGARIEGGPAEVERILDRLMSTLETYGSRSPQSVLQEGRD